MISAMPAVAVRRGRKPSKTFGRFGIRQPRSHHSSISSLNRSRSFSKRGAHHGISTISGVNQRLRYSSAANDIDLQRKRFLIYLGTLFLITGLLLVFIGVGASVPSAQTVGLLLIGVGAILCIIKVFYSEAQMTKIITKAPIHDESEDSADNLAAAPNTVSSNDITPVAEVAEFTSLPVSPTDNQDSSGTLPNSHEQTNNSVTPSGMNNMAETQVLIPEGSEKY